MPIRLCIDCHQPATYRGRCKAHNQQTNRASHPNKHIYNTVRWQRLRRHVLYKHPICQHCDQTLATDVDHVIPIEQGGSTWAQANLQALCHPCHSIKTRSEQAQ